MIKSAIFTDETSLKEINDNVQVLFEKTIKDKNFLGFPVDIYRTDDSYGAVFYGYNEKYVIVPTYEMQYKIDYFAGGDIPLFSQYIVHHVRQMIIKSIIDLYKAGNVEFNMENILVAKNSPYSDIKVAIEGCPKIVMENDELILKIKYGTGLLTGNVKE